MQLIIVDLKKGTGDDALLQKNHLHSSLHIIPTAASIMACVICFRVRDWLSFTMILLGMVSSGTTSLIMRTGKITHKRGKRGKPADGVPPGDGMLLSDTRIIILRGEEGDVNAVTKGKLRLELKRGYILLCAFIASSQITLQLVIMPFGSLPGQLMFLLSLLVSGASNLYLSAKEDDVRSSALITLLDNPTVKTYRANSRAVAAALACLALYRKPNTPPDQVLEVFKDANIVPVRHPEWWGKWFELVVGNIKRDEWYMSCNRGEGLQAEIIEDAEAAHDRYMRDIEFNLVT
ncbi:hypothetical protein EDB19DRAFT_1672247 [Suillus lakei]|nr:hypothetical protein EDB19DRAFT_1672247 [Suillus lakei]